MRGGGGGAGCKSEASLPRIILLAECNQANPLYITLSGMVHLRVLNAHIGEK